MEEIETFVSDNFEFEKRDEPKMKALFGQSDC